MSRHAAIRARKTGLTPWAAAMGRPIAVLLLLRFLSGAIESPQRAFFPVYMKELGYSALLLSLLATGQRLLSLFAGLIGGTLSDSWDRKWPLLVGQIGLLLASMVFLTPSLGWIAFFWAWNGIGTTMQVLSGQGYILDAAPPTRVGGLIAIFNWSVSLGGTLGSPLAALVLERWGYGPFGWVLVAASVVAVAANLALLPRSTPKQSPRSTSSTKLFGYADIARRPSVVLMVVMRIVPTLYWGMSVILIPLLLDGMGASKAAIAVYSAVSQLSGALAQYAAGRATDRFGGKWPTTAAFAALGVALLGIGVLPRQLWSVFAFGTLSTAGAWVLATMNPLMVAQVTPPEERGRVLGWIHLWWNVAMIVGAILGGLLFDRNPGLPFLIVGVLNSAAIALCFAFFKMAGGPASTHNHAESTAG